VNAAFAFFGAGCAASGPAASNASVAASLFEAQQKEAERNLATFDDLDFNVFSGQRWDDLHKSHAANVVVHWPDGHTTQGIEKHIDDLKAMFVWAPDTRIEVHPIKVAQKDWTAVVGVMEGTFTKPMPLGDGRSIPLTGKAYKITMATFSRGPHGRGVSVLGQPGVHEGDRTRKVRSGPSERRAQPPARRPHGASLGPRSA
jgi:hypothetical protein